MQRFCIFCLVNPVPLLMRTYCLASIHWFIEWPAICNIVRMAESWINKLCTYAQRKYVEVETEAYFFFIAADYIWMEPECIEFSTLSICFRFVLSFIVEMWNKKKLYFSLEKTEPNDNDFAIWMPEHGIIKLLSLHIRMQTRADSMKRHFSTLSK